MCGVLMARRKPAKPGIFHKDNKQHIYRNILKREMGSKWKPKQKAPLDMALLHGRNRASKKNPKCAKWAKKVLDKNLEYRTMLTKEWKAHQYAQGKDKQWVKDKRNEKSENLHAAMAKQAYHCGQNREGLFPMFDTSNYIPP